VDYSYSINSRSVIVDFQGKNIGKKRGLKKKEDRDKYDE
jgi:hypothetical protein